MACVDSHNILSKTAKGVAEASGKTTQLSRAVRNLLKGIDGRTPIADLAERFPAMPEGELLQTLEALEQQGYVRKLSLAGAPEAGAAKRQGAQAGASGESGDLDFTAAAPAEQESDYFAARKAAIERAREEANAKARAEGEAAARAEAAAEAAAKAKADAEAAAQAEAKRTQAAALVRAHQEAKARQAAEAREKAEAEAAELRRRLEEERKARDELERRAREDAERAVREVEERVRREAEERVRKEVEDRIRREDAERAGREAEARARTEAEAQTGKETSAFPTVEIPEPAADEALAKQADDERAQEVSRRFQEEQAKRDAERQAQREEAERKRTAAEAALREQAQAAEEAKRERLRQAEEQRRAAEEAERLRQEEQVQARAAALEKAVAAGAAAMAARQQANEDAGLTARQRRVQIAAREAEPAPRARKRGRIAAVLFLLAAGAAAAAHFVPLDAASFEREATQSLGAPVKIGSARLTLLPLPALRFERVSIGPAGDVRIAVASSRPGLSAIFDRQDALKTLELNGVQIPASWVGAAIWGKGGGSRTKHVIARGVKIEATGLDLPALTVDAKLDSGGALQSLSAQTTDGSQTFNLTMTGGQAAVAISARNFQLPFPGAVPLGDLTGSGTLTPRGLALGKFDLGAFGGSVKGNARLQWGASWSVEGEFIAASLDPRLATASLVPTGRLEGKGTFSMRAPAAEKLHGAARIDAVFAIKNGTLGFVDLTRALQGGAASGGTTSFASLDGNASFAGGAVRLTQLRLAAGLLNAAGEATVDATGTLSGRLQVNVSSQVRGGLTLGGTVAQPHVRTGTSQR